MTAVHQLTSSTLARTSAENVANLLPWAAEHNPNHGVYISAGESDGNRSSELVTYPMLLESAQQILGGLREYAGPPGRRVMLLLERPGDFLPTFWACLLGGYIPCPLASIKNDASRWAQHLEHVNVLLGQPLLVSAGTLLEGLPLSIEAHDLEKFRTSKRVAATPEPRKKDDPALLMLTSGSTGNAKAVELTHGNLLSSLSGRARRQQVTAEDTTLNWIAFDHVAALLESHMIALFVGATQVHTEPAQVLVDPLEFLRLIDRYRVTIAFAPNFLLGQLNLILQSDQIHSLALDLSCLRRIVTGGEANVVETSLRLLDSLAAYGAHRNVLWPAFGMTETCAACVYSDEFPQRDLDREFATVGIPVEGLEIRILTADGSARGSNEPGELQLRGPMIFQRYYNNEEATRAAFTSDGWFRTGDVGCIDDGRLSLIARTKDSIIVSGVNYYSHELESKLEQLQGITRSFVAAFPLRPKGADTEQLVVTFATKFPLSDEDRLYRLIVAVRNATVVLWGFRPAIILPLPQSAFPKTSLGKIQRTLMRRRLERGELDTDVARIETITSRKIGAYAAPQGASEIAMVELFAEILQVDPGAVSSCVSFFDLGGTSLDILKLTQTLKRRFNVSDPLSMVLQTPTVAKLAARIAAPENTREYDPIVPLQVSGEGAPLFCVHPGNGEIFSLLNLATCFRDERPFYALRPRGFNPGEEPFESVDQIIETYTDAIVRRQPHGPYLLAGYSLGCVIAFELAKELEARGKRVDFLGCIDFFPMSEPAPLDFHMATGLALVLDLITIDQYEEFNRQLRPARPTDEECQLILDRASTERLSALDLDLHKFATWARVAHSVEVLLLNHRTTGMAPRMTVFRGEGVSPRYTRDNWSKDNWRTQLELWNEFVSAPRYIDIPGTHHALLTPRYVDAIQAALRNELAMTDATCERA